MTPTESAYVGGIIDGEGHVEFKWANRTRKERKGSPTYRTLIVRLEVPQVDKRLIDWLMEITKEGSRDIKRYPDHPTWHDQHRWRVGDHGVYRVLKQVYPYFSVKKQKAKLVLEHYNKKSNNKTFGKVKSEQ